MTLILAVEAGERNSPVVGRGIDRRRVRGQWGDVRAGGGAWFITAIRAVAIVVVDLGDGDFVQRIGDAGEVCGGFVEVCD